MATTKTRKKPGVSGKGARLKGRVPHNQIPPPVAIDVKPDQVYTHYEVRAMLRLTSWQLCQALRKANLSAVTIGGSKRILGSDVQVLLGTAIIERPQQTETFLEREKRVEAARAQARLLGAKC